MAARTIVLTGASDGIGAAAARRLSRSGDTVVLVGRSEPKTRAVAEELGADYFLADFAELAQVRVLAAALLEAYPRIDVLANNAGGIMGHRQLSADGHELTFQVNHLAPFLLTTLLMDRLVESRASVLNTSSIANKLFAVLDVDDLESEKSYKPTTAYGNSKLENILFTRELHRRFHDQGISTAAFHPGNVASNFASQTSTAMRLIYHTPLKSLFLVSTEKGSDNLVWLASSEPGTDWRSGEYYIKHHVAQPNAQAYDEDLARELWERSEAMVSVAG